MKYVKILILSILSLPMTAQEEIKDFKLKDGVLIWEKVYETELGGAEILKYFQQLGIYESAEKGENWIGGNLKPFDMQVKSLGYDKNAAPIFLTGSSFIAYLMIEVKEKKYRATIKQMQTKAKVSVAYIQTAGEVSSIEEAVLKRNGAFRFFFKGKTSEIMQKNFESMCSIQGTQTDDW